MAGGRNDRAIVDALQAMAQALGTLNQQPEIFEVEKIFQALGCPLVQKVTLAAFMLFGEAEFPRDVRYRKQVKFLELKQGENFMAEYVTKFENLVRFCPMYDGVGNEDDKCVKFVSGLRPEIKQVFNYQGITQYHELVNKCRVYDKDNHSRVTHYKSGGPMKNHNKFGLSSKVNLTPSLSGIRVLK
ncbi:uncharacterized protein LOC109791694 [Cajanus cajan]|uniref:uncharacterized protein LOC109791694 n=1 Tax=Cajanus cajan TaxID=3821 RepID=UPI00098D79ED|nr:uncharacterized protein LOC109791694 [Cajanus cajan]